MYDTGLTDDILKAPGYEVARGTLGLFSEVYFIQEEPIESKRYREILGHCCKLVTSP